MIALGLGVLAAAALLWGARAFSQASVAGVKALVAWVVALGALSLAALLFLTGRGGLAIGALVVLGPMAWSYWKEGRGPVAGPAGGRMGRAEALAVLGLAEGASDSDVQAAWVRLMRVVHPDGGGSDELASRVNQAKDVLLKRR